MIDPVAWRQIRRRTSPPFQPACLDMPEPKLLPYRRRRSKCIGAAIVASALAVAAGATEIPRYDHVVVVVMENHGYSDIIGNTAQAPYINTLAGRGASFTQSYAIEHPSEPNYLDLFSGANQGVTDDSCPHTFSADNLGAQLIAASLSFAGYSEDLPVGGTACNSGAYHRKHNPWVNFTNVPDTSNRSYSEFPADFAALPTLAFVVPNQCHDMHGDSGCSSNLIAAGDAWLQAQVDAYAQWAPTHNSLLVLTFDEDDGGELNRIATIFAGAMVVPGQYGESIDHYTVLATLESMYGLTAIAGAAARNPITDVWDTRLFKDGFDP